MGGSVLRLDIASGRNKKEGFVGVDLWPGADIVWDLTRYPWPFDDCSIDEVYCSHYIEHVSDLMAFMNELHRIMKTGAAAHVIAPYYASIRAWQDPTHVRAISEATFWYFNYEWRSRGGLNHYPITADFDFTVEFDLFPDWRGKDDAETRFAVRHYYNVVSDIHVKLVKRKPDFIQAEDKWCDGGYGDAVAICRQLLSSHENSSDVYLMLAENSLRLKDFGDAASFFRQALELDSVSVQAHAGLLRALKENGEVEDAGEHLDTLRREYPDLYEVLSGIVDISNPER